MPRTVIAFLLLFATFAPDANASTDFSKALGSAEQSAEQSAAVQLEIESASEASDAFLRKFREENRRLEDLRLYNRQLELRIKDQVELIEQLKTLRRSAGKFEKRIPPLLLRMVESLEQFVALDMPFLAAERAKRIESLRRLMVRGDITMAEQFRKVFEAYLEEIEYGNTIGSYQGSVEIDSGRRRVTFLRVGRIALLYQTDDVSSVGMWDTAEKKWKPLGGEYKDPIRRGIAIAREQAAPNLLFIPVSAAREEEN